MSDQIVFQVTVHTSDSSTSSYTCLACDDITARVMGIAAMIRDHIEAGAKPPDVLFCQIKMICYVDETPVVK